MYENIYKKAIRKFGIRIQTVILMEELAELIQEASKLIRNDFQTVERSFVEEIVDVDIMLYQIKYFIRENIENFEVLYWNIKNDKLKKLKERLNK